MKRRDLLRSLGVMAASVSVAGRIHAKELDTIPASTAINHRMLPTPIKEGGFQVLTDENLRNTLAACFDRLIPADDLGASATQAGCVEFIDAQLAGPFGEGASMYRDTPKLANEDELMQVAQFISTPRERYESGLQALDKYSRTHHQAPFYQLDEKAQDNILQGMDEGTLTLSDEINTKAFFELMLINVREGYFSDPLYGGNREMVGWKMIGFPGARYDYRLYADRTGQKLDLQPVSMIPDN